MPKTASGRKIIKILVNYFGFEVVRQKGSHVKLRKRIPAGHVTTIVPLHSELAHGTLRGVLELARIEWDNFEKYI